MEPNTFARVYRRALDPALHGHPGFGYRTEERDGVFVERDVAVPVRGGLTLYADVFRPVSGTDLPAIICYAPFGKHPHIDLEKTFPNSGIPFDKLSKDTPFEVFDPMLWAREGFAICVVDGVGNWYSEGTPHFFSQDEAEAGYDVVEWFAGRPWCNGRVGWGAVSYYAMTAWSVAALRPPHLAAILAWDGASDNYRETCFTGGIPLSSLSHNWMTLTGIGLGEVEDWEIGTLDHPFDDAHWRSRVADWSRIEVPTYAVSEWGNNLHLRGTLEAWKAIASTNKFLDVSGGKEWADFYSDWAFERQRAFLGEFLKGEDNGVASGWAPVRLALRENGRDWTFREEPAWPLDRAEYRMLHLDAQAGTLGGDRPADEASVRYVSTDPADAATFTVTFAERTEITGNSKLHLWLSTDRAADADIFVVYEKLDRDGRAVPFVYSQMTDDGPPSFGWLRASHRELDEDRSRPEQPYHRHQRALWLIHREPVVLDIEIWPTNIVFDAGESLRLVVRGSEYNTGDGSGFVLKHWPLRNDGNHILHTGGRYDSYLLVPFVPADDRPADT